MERVTLFRILLDPTVAIPRGIRSGRSGFEVAIPAVTRPVLIDYPNAMSPQ